MDKDPKSDWSLREKIIIGVVLLILTTIGTVGHQLTEDKWWTVFNVPAALLIIGAFFSGVSKLLGLEHAFKAAHKLFDNVEKYLSGLTMPQFRKATLSIVFSIGFFLLIYPPYRSIESKAHSQYDFLWSPPYGSEISTSQLVVTEAAVLFAAAIFWFITSPNSDK